MRLVKNGREANRSTDGICRKYRFASKAKARKKLRGPYVGRSSTKSVYFCHECQAWHLSSQRER